MFAFCILQLRRVAWARCYRAATVPPLTLQIIVRMRLRCVECRTRLSPLEMDYLETTGGDDSSFR